MAKQATVCHDEVHRLIALARLAQQGDRCAAERLAARVSRAVAPHALLKGLIGVLRNENADRQENQLKRQRKKEEVLSSAVSAKRPQFLKKLRKKRRRSEDAMFRAILCGGFETNRSRH